MKSILVTGSAGQLGKSLKDISGNYPFHFHFLDKADLDIAHEESIEAAFSILKPSFVLNCAAYTAVDRAESEKDSAFRINADAVKLLAGAAARCKAGFMHVSTDYVFNGRGTEPYREADPCDPVNVYGASKLQGERWAQQHHSSAVIIRTSWVYSEHGNNFVKTMLRLMSSKPELKVVSDQWGSPTYARDLAEVMMTIVMKETIIPGVYHFSNEGVINWFQFAEAIRELSGNKLPLHPITTQEYPTPAHRPAYSVLDKSAIVDAYGIALRPWKESLRQCMKNLASLNA